jgi:hypothetical protein
MIIFSAGNSSTGNSSIGNLMKINEIIPRTKDRVMETILSKTLNSKEIFEAIIFFEGKFIFTFEDMKKIFNDGLLSFIDICTLIFNNYVEECTKEEIMEMILSKTLNSKEILSKQIVTVIASFKGRFIFTFEDMKKIFNDGLLSFIDICTLMFNNYVEECTKEEIMEMILSKTLNSKEILSKQIVTVIVKLKRNGKFIFTFKDIEKIFNDGLLFFVDICRLILKDCVKCTKEEMMIIILSKNLNSYEIALAILAFKGKFIFTFEDMKKIFNDGLLSFVDICRLILKDCVKCTKEEIMEVILEIGSKEERMEMILKIIETILRKTFNSQDTIGIIKFLKFNITFDDIFTMIHSDSLNEAGIMDLMVKYYRLLREAECRFNSSLPNHPDNDDGSSSCLICVF